MLHLKRPLCFALLLALFWQPAAGAPDPGPEHLAHTFSIVARDPVSGEMGVAVQTHWPGVGRMVPWAEAGVGAIATQALTNASLGPHGLALLREGHAAREVLDRLLDSDAGREQRQLGVMDNTGSTAAWTGAQCIPDAGHLTGENFAVQANLMANDRVWPAMAAAFRDADGPLAERMLVALEAGQQVGGDLRGRQSAALIVVGGEPTRHPGEGRVHRIDLRVDDHPEPIAELKRLLRLDQAYRHMFDANDAVTAGDLTAAAAGLARARELAPGNLEIPYWHAVALANAGRVDASLPLFREVFRQDAAWWTLTERLPGVEVLKVDAAELRRILSQHDGAREHPVQEAGSR